MAPFKSVKSDEQRRKDTVVMVSVILFIGLVLGGILGYKIDAVESIDAAEAEELREADANRKEGEPIKREPDPWGM